MVGCGAHPGRMSGAIAVFLVWVAVWNSLGVGVVGQPAENENGRSRERGKAVLRKRNYPWFSTVAGVDRSGGRSIVCGGALISSRHVVTTKKCIERAVAAPDNEIEVEVGYLCDRDDNCGRNKERSFRLSSEQVTLHPTLDVAIVTLRRAEQRTLRLLSEIAAVVDTGESSSSMQRGDRLDMIGLERGDFNRRSTTGDAAGITTLSLLRKFRVGYTSVNKCVSGQDDKAAIDFSICAIAKQPRNDCRVASMGSSLVKRAAQEGGRDVIMGLQSMLPPNPCVTRGGEDEDALSARRLRMGQVLLSEAIGFLRTVVCVDEEESMTTLPEDDWCLSGPPPATEVSLVSYALQYTLQGHTAQVEPVVYASRLATTALLASGSYDGTIVLSDPTNGQNFFTQTAAHSNRVATLQFHTSTIGGAERIRLASASEGNDIKVWNVVRNAADVPAISLDPNPIVLQGHADQVRAVKWHSDGTTLISASYDFTIKVWNVSEDAEDGSPRLLRTIRGHSDWVNAVALHPDRPNQLVSVSDDETVRLWNVQTGLSLGMVVAAHDSWISSVDYSPDGRYLATGSIDDTVRIWRVLPISEDADTATEPPDAQQEAPSSSPTPVPPFELLDTLQGHDSWVYFVRWSPAGRYVASSSRDETIRIWGPSVPGDFSSPWKTLLTLEGHTDNVLSLDWSPDGSHLASASLDRTVRIWELIEGKLQPESSTDS